LAFLPSTVAIVEKEILYTFECFGGCDRGTLRESGWVGQLEVVIDDDDTYVLCPPWEKSRGTTSPRPSNAQRLIERKGK
jgi:hypothetical protein